MEKIIFYTACRAFGAGALLMLALAVLAWLIVRAESRRRTGHR